MKDKDIIIKELETKVQELQEELEMANAVKKTEVALNRGFKQQLEVKDIQIEEIVEINKKMLEKNAELRIRLKDLSVKFR